MEVARGQLVGEKARGIFDLAAATAAQVGDVQLRRLAIQVAHRLGDAAQVLERVVGGEHAVEVRAARQYRALGALEMLGIEVAAAADLAPGGFVRAVGVLHLVQVQLGHLAIALGLVRPGVGGQRGGFQAGAVLARGGGEDARLASVTGGLGIQTTLEQVGLYAQGIGAHRVVGFIGFGGEFHCLGQQADDVGELVAIEAGGGEHHVDPWPSQLGARNQLDIADPAAAIPHWPHA